MKNKIIIVSGDPNSINSEIIYKSWKKLNKSLKRRIFVISNTRLLTHQFKKLRYAIKILPNRFCSYSFMRVNDVLC